MTSRNDSEWITDIELTLQALTAGKTILYPTDTVWGIGCDATNEAAVEKVYTIKGRSQEKSMIILVANLKMLLEYVSETPNSVQLLLETEHRPLTIIYPIAKKLPGNVLAKDGSIGIRITMDPFCKAVISDFGKPIVSTSANLTGEKTPDDFNQISEKIKSGVDYVVQSRRNEQRNKIPSKIVKLDGEQIIVLRE